MGQFLATKIRDFGLNELVSSFKDHMWSFEGIKGQFDNIKNVKI